MTGPRITAAIMAHPSRRDAAEALQRAHPELAAKMVLDPDPAGPPTTLRSARLAWRASDVDATHHLVLTDDALPTRHFAEQLAAAVAARPNEVLSFFCMWSTRNSYAVRLAALLGNPWVENVSRYVPCQALVAPAAVARKIADYLEHEAVIDAGRLAPHDNEDDMSVHRCLRRLGVRALLSVPSLVDHPRRASLLGHPGDQPAACMIRDTGIAPQWSASPLAPRRIPHVHYGTARAFCDMRDDPRQDWRTVSTEEYLAGRGVSTHELVKMLLRQLSPSPRAAAVARRIGFAPVYQVWISAYALGTVFADEVGTPDPARTLDGALTRPVASDALASLAGGALHQILYPEELAAVRGELDALVVNAVRLGAVCGPASALFTADRG